MPLNWLGWFPEESPPTLLNKGGVRVINFDFGGNWGRVIMLGSELKTLYDLCYGFFSRPDNTTHELTFILVLNKMMKWYFNPHFLSVKLEDCFEFCVELYPDTMESSYLLLCLSEKVYAQAIHSDYFNPQILAILPPSVYYLSKNAPHLETTLRWSYLDAWWEVNHQRWIEQFTKLMINCRNLGYHGNITESQKQLLQHYYYANKLLMDCLNVADHVSPLVREEIEETILLPKDEIDNWKKRRSI